MNLFMLISLLSDYSCLVPTEVCLISDDKLRHCQCKSSRAVEAKIHKLWSQYVDGEKSTWAAIGGNHSISEDNFNTSSLIGNFFIF